MEIQKQSPLAYFLNKRGEITDEIESLTAKLEDQKDRLEEVDVAISLLLQDRYDEI